MMLDISKGTISLETPIDSHFEYTEQNWTIAAHFLNKFMKHIITDGFPTDVDVLKIDVPCTATTETPWKVTRLSTNMHYQASIPVPSLQSKLNETVVHKGTGNNEPDGTDIYALTKEKVVSVTPLSLDLTAHSSFHQFSNWSI